VKAFPSPMISRPGGNSWGGWWIFLLIASLSFGTPANAGTFEQHQYHDQAGDHTYSVYLPDGYSTNREWPVVLFLHGAGERGTDGQKPLSVGLGAVLRAKAVEFPFVAVFPQCEDTTGPILTAWEAESPDGRRALAILDQVLEKYSIDPRRQILTGWSMGSFGAVSLAEAAPDRWQGVITVSGGGAPRDPSRLRSVPFWIFHGADDEIVLPEQSRNLASALEKSDGKSRLEILPAQGHAVWKEVYRSPAVIRWMREPDRDIAYAAPSPLPESSPLRGDDLHPFRPALEIPRAAYVRFGNKMMAAFAESVPEMIPEDLLAGSLGNIYDSTTAAGRDFNVVFSNISYRGNVARTHLESYRKDRLNIQLGLSNVVMRIGRTDVSGSGKSAVAGPIDVVIGHREPVWLSLAVEPMVVDRKLKLKLIASRFRIPQQNWYVSQPAGVSTRGLGMTRERVVDGLTTGLYGSKGRIEREVEAMGGEIVRRLEKEIETAESVTDLMDYLWPLPVYRPRIDLWPESIHTDERGVTMLLGMSVAAHDPAQAPARPRVDTSESLSVEAIPPTEDLQVGTASNLLRPLTEQLIREDVARVHLQDIPGRPFRELEDAETLSRLLPESKRLGDALRFRTELVMSAPLTVATATVPTASTPPEGAEEPEAVDTGGIGLDLHLDPVELRVSVWDESAGIWQRFAVFEIDLRQGVQVDAQYPSFSERQVDLGWNGQLQVAATGNYEEAFRSGESSVDADEAARLFEAGWRRWTGKRERQRVKIPDVEFGHTLLRLSKSGWEPPQVFARFAPPGIKLSNFSNEPLQYRIRTIRSGWSEPYSLAPEKSHRFEGVAKFYMELSGIEGQNRFTIPAGAHAVFQVPQSGSAPGLFLK
jgi:predicted esterase